MPESVCLVLVISYIYILALASTTDREPTEPQYLYMMR